MSKLLWHIALTLVLGYNTENAQWLPSSDGDIKPCWGHQAMLGTSNHSFFI